MRPRPTPRGKRSTVARSKNCHNMRQFGTVIPETSPVAKSCCGFLHWHREGACRSAPNLGACPHCFEVSPNLRLEPLARACQSALERGPDSILMHCSIPGAASRRGGRPLSSPRAASPKAPAQDSLILSISFARRWIENPCPYRSWTLCPPVCPVSRFETLDGEHGRIETRRYTVIHDVEWLRETP